MTWSDSSRSRPRKRPLPTIVNPEFLMKRMARWFCSFMPNHSQSCPVTFGPSPIACINADAVPLPCSALVDVDPAAVPAGRPTPCRSAAGPGQHHVTTGFPGGPSTTRNWALAMCCRNPVGCEFGRDGLRWLPRVMAGTGRSRRRGQARSRPRRRSSQVGPQACDRGIGAGWGPDLATWRPAPQRSARRPGRPATRTPRGVQRRWNRERLVALERLAGQRVPTCRRERPPRPTSPFCQHRRHQQVVTENCRSASVPGTPSGRAHRRDTGGHRLVDHRLCGTGYNGVDLRRLRRRGRVSGVSYNSCWFWAGRLLRACAS